MKPDELRKADTGTYSAFFVYFEYLRASKGITFYLNFATQNTTIMKAIYSLIHNRKNKLNKNGEALVQIYVYSNKDRKILST